MMLKSFFLLILVATIAQATKAEKMSYENHSLVIKKLETALSLMNKKDPSLIPTTKRLADLYSERARIAEYKENEKNCNNCFKSNGDRLKAISKYNSVMNLGLENGAIITQLAHLYTLTHQADKSISLYRRIIKAGSPTYNHLLVGEAHLAIAYIDYKQNKFKLALKNFEKAKKHKTKQPTSVTNYYIAWCKFNLGQESAARQLMESSLKQAVQQAKTSSDMADFAKQASRDLTILYARTNLTPQRINNLLNLTPKSMQISNFKALAEEVERLGKHKSTARIWGLITKVTQNPTAKIEASFRYAKSSYNIGHKKTAQTQYNQAIQLWKSQGCKTSEDFDCKELKVHMRNFVISWNNTEKSKPSLSLFNTYLAYLSLFSDDNEMLQWAAQTAVYRKDQSSARNLYRRISENNMNEGSLLAEIEAAEKTNNNSLKLDSYNYYLSNNSKGKQVNNIKYQKAQTLYDLKNYAQANVIFCKLAQQKIKSIGLKAAHLCLDTYALMKQSDKVESLALAFATSYKSQRIEFMKIARNAGLNLVASNLKQKSSNRALRANLKKLQNINLVAATLKERVKVYKNIITVAEKLGDIPQALQATNIMYRTKGLSKSDNNFCVQKQIYFNETLLNFKTALAKYKKLHPVKKASKAQLIRMSVLSELAGLSSRKYDEMILKKTKGTYAANKVRAKLVLNSSKPWSTFKKYESKLKKSKKLYSALALEVYSLSPSNKQRNRVLKNSFVKYQAHGQRLHRTENLKLINILKSKTAKHKIISSNNRLLTKTLKRRLNLLSQLETAYADSAKDKDWLSQLVALENISRQYNRLYNDILSFAIPKGLKTNEVVQYKALLRQQATPYLKKSQTAQNKANVFWNNNQLFSHLVIQHNSAKKSIQKLITFEIKELSRYAPSLRRATLAQAVTQPAPNKKMIAQVYKKIKQTPFNTSALNAGVNLEKTLGRDTRATYFAERLKLSNKRKVN